jgi:hypothetical protein
MSDNSDNDDPIRMYKGPGGVIKIKRGGAASSGNSGAAHKRTRTPVRAIRNPEGRHLPWPTQGKPVWDPNVDGQKFAIARR